MAAVAFAGADERIAYDDLRSALREVLRDAVPQKHEVTRAIQQMCKIAKDMKVRSATQRTGGEDSDSADEADVPAVDWQDETFLINDVFLRFYLRWIHRVELLNSRQSLN